MSQTSEITPLTIRSAKDDAVYVMHPVPDEALGMPVPIGRVIHLHSDDAHRARKYLERHQTQIVAVRDSAAFTLIHGHLVQCSFMWGEKSWQEAIAAPQEHLRDATAA